MKRAFWIVVAIATATLVGCNCKPSIKLIEELPAEQIGAYRGCSVAVEDGVASVLAAEGMSDSGIEIWADYDLTEYKCARFTVENIDAAPLYIYVTFAHDKVTYYRGRCSMPMAVGHLYFFQPGEKREIELPFPRPLENPDVEADFFKYGKNNMLYTPYAHAFGLASYAGDLSRVKQILFRAKTMGFGTLEHKGWRLSDFEIVAGKRKENPDVVKLSHEEFYPFIDQYGQYKHHEWEGKIHSDEELKQAIEKEEADLAQHTAPATFNKYGGWADGPRQEATGRFYLKKVDGKWWFVDPEGCL